MIIPPRADLPVPGVSGPTPIPSAAVTPTPNALIPVAPRAANVIPDIFRQSDTIPDATQVSRNLDRSYVPIRPMATAGKLVLDVAPWINHGRTLNNTWRFFISPPDADLGSGTSRDLAVGPISPAARSQIVTTLSSPNNQGKVTTSTQARIVQNDNPQALFGLLFVGTPDVPAGSAFQCILYSVEGTKIGIFPDGDEEWIPFKPGLNVLPIPATKVGDVIIHPFPKGSYIWGLRLRIDGRIITHTESVAMEVQ